MEEGSSKLTFRDALWIRLSGEAVQFLTFTGPFLAEPAKAWLLESRGLTAVEGFAATLTAYLSGTAVLIEGAAKFVGLAFFFIPGQVGASEGAHTIIFEIVGLPAARTHPPR